MEENQFWLKLWQLAAAVAIVGITTAGGCTAYESKRIADAVGEGKDPISARCAIAGVQSSAMMTICAARAFVTR